MHTTLNLSKDNRYRDVLNANSVPVFLLGFAAFLLLVSNGVTVYADNFADLLHTNSFRGAFEWINKLDWIGMIVQAVISIFSLVGVSLIVIRIMTSMLYLSAKGLWEEVHDLKQSGGESEMYDFGVINMAKSWAKGKSGTGLDAIMGAVLMLLPDVKRYSDFGEKSGNKFEEDITIGQYVLKILMPTVIAVFCLAMGFNGTLVQGIAVTVDAMGTIADKTVSVNYAGFIEDLVNSGTGYKFTFSADGTKRGELQQYIARELYGRAVAAVDNPTQAQLHAIGKNVEDVVRNNFATWVSESTQISSQIREKVIMGAGADVDAETLQQVDRYFGYLGYEMIPNVSTEGRGSYVTLRQLLGMGATTSTPTYSTETAVQDISGNWVDAAGNAWQWFDADGNPVTEADYMAANNPSGGADSSLGALIDDGMAQDTVFHIYIKQTNSYSGSYFNTDDIA